MDEETFPTIRKRLLIARLHEILENGTVRWWVPNHGLQIEDVICMGGEPCKVLSVTDDSFTVEVYTDV